jgi:hypothetical protein
MVSLYSFLILYPILPKKKYLAGRKIYLKAREKNKMRK